MMCLPAAPWVQLSVSAGNGWPHNALRHHWLMPVSCHFRDCKALLVTSLTHVSGAITSVQTFTFTFIVLTRFCWLSRTHIHTNTCQLTTNTVLALRQNHFLVCWHRQRRWKQYQLSLSWLVKYPLSYSSFHWFMFKFKFNVQCALGTEQPRHRQTTHRVVRVVCWWPRAAGTVELQ